MFYGILGAVYSNNMLDYLINPDLTTGDKPNTTGEMYASKPNNTNPNSNSNSNHLAYYIKGAIAGMAGIILSHPVDTVKTHIQTGHPLRTFQPSIGSFYRGLLSPLLGVGVEKAIVFGTYNYMLRQMRESNSGAIPLAGAVAGLTASAVVTPYERFKILMQNGTSFARSDITASFLFRGFSATLTREVPGFAIYFTVYEGLKYHNFTQHGRTIEYINSFIYGGISGVAAWIFIYPQDQIKTILQSSNSNENKLGKLGFISVMRDIYAKGGLRYFYSGFSWAVARAMLLHSGTFCMMEVLNSKF